MITTRIGELDQGIDGTDVYFLIECPLVESVNSSIHRCQVVQERFLRQHYQQGTHPGGRFCNSVTVVQKPYSRTQFIGIVHVRYDI